MIFPPLKYWNFRVLELLLRTLIFLWPACLYFWSINLKVLLTWVCSCIKFQYFGWNYFIFYIFSRLQRPASKVYILWCKTGINSWNLFEKVYFLHEDSFLHFIHFFAMWSISAFILSVIAWKAPASSWSRSKLVIYLKMIPGVSGRSVNFKIP